MAAVAITGMGAICGCGPDVPSLWTALRDGRSGLGPLTRFPGRGTVGEVPTEGPGDAVITMALRAAEEAWSPGSDPSRCAVVVGTSAGPLSTESMTEAEERADPVGTARRKVAAHHGAIAWAVAEHLGLRGPRITVSTACSSGNAALAVARDLLLGGDADRVLVGGADGLSPRRYAGFAALGALAPGPCAPFSEPVGLNLGEGAAFLVLEALPPGSERALAWLLGWGSSADGVHATAPDPSGAGMARSIRAALRDAGLAAGDVDWYAAHGTGTELNDAAEWRAVVETLGEDVPVSAPKSFFGHPFGACGPLQAIAAVLAIRNGAVPPTLRFVGPRGDGPRDPVAEGRAREMPVRAVVSHNAAFGGANHTVVVGAGAGRAPRSDRRVFVHGIGSADGRRLPGVDLRKMDPVSAFWTAAAANAVGRFPLRGAAGERCGQVAGTSRRPHSATSAYRASWETRGPAGVSVQAFARTVMNAPLGDASRALGLRGPMELLVAGAASSVLAVARGARWIASRDDLDEVVAGGFDEHDPYRLGLDPEDPYDPRPLEGARHAQGAVAVVLAPSPSPVRVAGVAVAGSLAEAVDRIRAAGPPDAVFPVGVAFPGPEPRLSAAERVGTSEGVTGAAAVAWAVEAVREGRVGRAWVVAADQRACAVALVLEGA